MNRAFALTIGFLALLAPATAHAQTNIDQGKSASQLFANACAECHKAPHTLAKGKSATTVAEFLREHYTTGRDQAAALAVYVVSGRDTVAAPVPGRKPAAAAAQRPGEAPSANANAKPHRPGEAEATSSGGSMMNPLVRSEPVSRDSKPTTATRNRRKEPGTPEGPQEPAAVAHAPSDAAEAAAHPEPATAQEQPTSAVAPAAAAPPEAPAAASGEAMPRDNIPD